MDPMGKNAAFVDVQWKLTHSSTHLATQKSDLCLSLSLAGFLAPKKWLQITAFSWAPGKTCLWSSKWNDMGPPMAMAKNEWISLGIISPWYKWSEMGSLQLPGVTWFGSKGPNYPKQRKGIRFGLPWYCPLSIWLRFFDVQKLSHVNVNITEVYSPGSLTARPWKRDGWKMKFLSFPFGMVTSSETMPNFRLTFRAKKTFAPIFVKQKTSLFRGFVKGSPGWNKTTKSPGG